MPKKDRSYNQGEEKRSDLKQHKLFEDKNFLQNLTTISPVCIVRVNSDGHITYANPKAEDVLKLKVSEITDRTYNDPKWQIVDVDGNPFPVESLPFSVVKKTLKPVENIRHAIKHKDGTLVYLSINAVPELDEEGVFIGMVATLNDITEQRAQEKKLQEKTEDIEAMNEELRTQNEELASAYKDIKDSEEKLIEAQHLAQLGDFSWNVQTGEVIWSEGMFELLGYDKKSKIDLEKVNKKIHHPDDVDRVMNWLYDCMNKKLTKLTPNEYRVMRADGKVLTIHTEGNIEYKKGEPYIIFGMCQDITERVQAEKEIHMLSQFPIQNPNPVLRIDEDGKIIFKNKASTPILEKWNAKKDIISGDPLDCVLKAMKTGSPVRSVIEHKDTYYSLTFAMVPDSNLVNVYGFDITEQEKISRSLQQKTEEIEAMNEELRAQNEELEKLFNQIKDSEEKFHSIFDNVSEGLIYMDMKGSIIEVNQELCNMVDMNKEELVDKKALTLAKKLLNIKMITPVIEKISQLLKGRQVENFEIEYNGKILEISAAIHKGDKHIISVIRDITELKKAEIEIAKRERLLRFAIEQNPVPVIIARAPNAEILYFNKAAENLLVKPTDVKEIILQEHRVNWPTFYPDGTPYNVEDLPLTRAIKKGEVTEGVEIIVRHEDKDHWINASAAPLRNEEGEIIAGIVSFPEITEQKESERKIKEGHARLLAILNGIKEPIYISDPNTYEMIFANQVVKDIFGTFDNKKCYEYLQERNEPCPFCTNDKILGEYSDESYIWEFKNEINDRWYRCIDKAIQWPDGRMLRYEMAIDIHEKKQVEEALKENERLLNEVGRIAKIGGWEMDLIKRTAKWTKGTYDIVEIAYGDPVPGPDEHVAYYLPEYRDMINSKIEYLIEHGGEMEFEAELRTAKGNIKWCKAYGRRIMDEGTCVKIYGTFQDIHSQKLIEIALKESEERFRELFNTMGSCVAVYEPYNEGEDFIFRDVNSAAEIHSKIKKEDVVGKKVTQVFPSVKEIGLFEVFQEVYKTGEKIHHPLVMYKDNRIDEWVENDVYKLPGGEIVAVYEDTSAQRIAEQALKDSEERLRLFFESPVFGTIHGDIHGRVIEANDEYLRIIGYTREELEEGKIDWAKITPKEDLKIDEEHIKEAKKRGVCTPYEKRYIRKDGSIIWVLVGYALVGEKREESMAFIIDITEEKEATKELETFWNVSPDLICIADNTTATFVKINPSFTKILGFTEEELLGKSFIEFVHPDDKQKTRDVIDQKLKEGIIVINFTNRFICKDGSYRYLNWISRPDQETGLTYAIARDITEEFKMEEKLIKNEELLRETGKVAKVGGWELDAKTQKVSWSEEIYRIHEVPMDHEPPLEEAINFFHPDDRPLLQEALKKALEHGEPYDLELRFITARGKNLITHSLCQPIIEDGKVVKLFGTFQDITELKKAQEALKKHRDHLEELVKARTAKLREQNKELERMNKLFEGREYRIKELRDKVAALEKKLDEE